MNMQDGMIPNNKRWILLQMQIHATIALAEQLAHLSITQVRFSRTEGVQLLHVHQLRRHPEAAEAAGDPRDVAACAGLGK
jgi:hypothetical protein